MKRLLAIIAVIASIACSTGVFASTANNTSSVNASEKSSDINIVLDYNTTGDFPYTHYYIALAPGGKMELRYTSAKTKKEITREGSYTAIPAGGNTYRIDYTLSRIKKGDAWIPSELSGAFTITIKRDAHKATVVPNKGNELGIGIGASRTLDF